MHKNILQILNQIEPSNDWELTGPVIRARESDIYQATAISSGLSLAIKHYNSLTNQNAAQRQYSALQSYQDSMTGQQDLFRVPKVYAFDSGHRLLIMEWVNGRSLHQCFWISLKTLLAKKRTLKHCGQWLRTFHEKSSPTKDDVNLNTYMVGIERELSKQKDNSSPLSAGVGVTHNILVKVIQQCPEISATHATLHGDFTPHNLILDGDKTVGVDIWAAAKKPVLVDLSRMLVYLTIAYPLVVLRQPIFDKAGKFNNAVAPLIEGYGLDLIDPQTLHFKIALLSEYLRRWLVIAGRRPTAVSRLTNNFQIMQIKKNIKALSALMPPV